MLNPIAPPALQGIDPSAPMGFLDIPFSYVYDVTLEANQALFNEVTSIFTEADFCWRGLIFSQTGLFQVRFQDGQGYYLSAGMVFSSNLPNTAGDPFPWFPEILYPAGGQMQLDIQDLSGAENVVQILFVGANRYRIKQ
jgi:hypothetical protein